MTYGSVRTLPSLSMVTALRAKNNRNVFLEFIVLANNKIIYFELKMNNQQNKLCNSSIRDTLSNKISSFSLNKTL